MSLITYRGDSVNNDSTVKLYFAHFTRCSGSTLVKCDDKARYSRANLAVNIHDSEIKR